MATLANYLITYQPDLAINDYIKLIFDTQYMFDQFKIKKRTEESIKTIIESILTSNPLNSNFIIMHLIKIRCGQHIQNIQNMRESYVYFDDILSDHIENASFTVTELLTYVGYNPLLKTKNIFLTDALICELIKKG